MKHITLFLTSVALAGNVALNPGPIGDDSEWLKYHSGNSAWFSWDGVCRGVWFDLQDFYPGSIYYSTVERAAFWFYHDAAYPWDTGEVYLEVWNGGASGPTVALDQCLATAIHYGPTFSDYDPPVSTDDNFWVLVNTELSAGGWPSLLGDGSQSGEAHSFFSSDFLYWQPWSPDGLCNYFISADWFGWGSGALEGTTWGALKSSF